MASGGMVLRAAGGQQQAEGSEANPGRLLADTHPFPHRVCAMKIARIAAYRVELPLQEGSYKWSGGKSVDVFDSTIVRVETDTGLAGHGEVCPLGPAYLPAYAEGVRAGIAMLAPRLIGEDPRELERLNRTMDAALKGH